MLRWVSFALFFFFGSNLIRFKILIWVCILIESSINFVLHQCSFCFFFFLLDSRGHYGKSAKRAFSLQAFPPDLGGKNLWAWRENFLPGFPSSLFYFVCQTVENTVFHSIFLPRFSILPKFTLTKHSVNLKVVNYSLRPTLFVLFEKSNFLRERHLLSCLPFKNV